MRRIEVVQGTKKGLFRVLVNYVQEGCELHSHLLANHQASQLKTKYPAAIIIPINLEIKG